MRRKPAELHVLHGTFRRDRHTEPLAIAGPGQNPPEFLDGAALVEWNRVAPILSSAGILTALDRATLAAYCATFARWVAASKSMGDELIVRSPNGYPIQNPFLAIVNTSLREMRAFAADLGMSPSARSRVNVVSQPRLGVMKRERGGRNDAS